MAKQPQLPEMTPLLLYQLPRPTSFNHRSRIHHKQGVKIHNHLQAMAYHDNSVAPKLLPNDSLHSSIGLMVYIRANFVEGELHRILHHRSQHRDPVPGSCAAESHARG